MWVEEVIDVFEMFGGCVKTLYLCIYVGILVWCDLLEDMVMFVEYDIEFIDFVCVSFYLFMLVVGWF